MKYSPPCQGRLRIIYIHHGQVPGGAPTSLRVLAEEVGNQDGRIDRTIACAYPQMMPYFGEVNGVEVEKYPEAPILIGKKLIGWNPIFTLRSLDQVIRQIVTAPKIVAEEAAWLKSRQPDIVHLNSATLWSSALAARRVGIPVVWHVRETLYGGRFSFRKWVYGRFIRGKADKVIAISPTDAESLGPDVNNKVQVIYNAVNLADYAPGKHDKDETRAQLGLPSDAFIALSLGGFSYRKGAWQLVRALKKTSENIHLVIAGGQIPPPPKPPSFLARVRWTLEDWSVVLGVAPTQTWNYSARVASEIPDNEARLHCPGHVGDVTKWISACGVLVFGGVISHFARPVYEAWAMGKPVIAFDTPAMRREIDDEKDGLLVSRESPGELAMALRRLAANPELCAAMGEKGRLKALSRFDRTKNTKKVIELYRTLTAAGSAEADQS